MNPSSHKPQPETPTPGVGGEAFDQRTAHRAEEVRPHGITPPRRMVNQSATQVTRPKSIARRKGKRGWRK